MDAALESLGTEQTRLTVRGVCKRSGLAARYFYENFEDLAALEHAVFDHVVNLVAEATLAAVAAAGERGRDKIAAGLGRIIELIGDDPRLGRLLFSSALTGEVFARRRADSARLFTTLLGQQARQHYGAVEHLDVTSQFAVGGFAQVLTAWLDGTLEIDRAELVERATELFSRISSRDG